MLFFNEKYVQIPTFSYFFKKIFACLPKKHYLCAVFATFAKVCYQFVQKITNLKTFCYEKNLYSYFRGSSYP